MEPKCEVCSGTEFNVLEDRLKCKDCDSEQPLDRHSLRKRIQKMIEDHHDEYCELLDDYHGRIEKCHYQGDPIYDLADDIIKLVRK